MGNNEIKTNVPFLDSCDMTAKNKVCHEGIERPKLFHRFLIKGSNRIEHASHKNVLTLQSLAVGIFSALKPVTESVSLPVTILKI